ncbi:MAG: hypothetical protein VKL59_21045 [Nostocaceae cyanobacterium]|nr:hypothetical protein [Nostocaceae cyanobacterium]
MDNWQKDLLEMMEGVATEVERFLAGMGEVVDSFLELSEEITEQIHSSIATEIDEYFHELVEPIFEVYSELEELVIEDIEPSFPYKVEATTEKNPACIGCHHYHGEVYSGNLLVCGMHPYGWEDATCPDWEQE